VAVDQIRVQIVGVDMVGEEPFRSGKIPVLNNFPCTRAARDLGGSRFWDFGVWFPSMSRCKIPPLIFQISDGRSKESVDDEEFQLLHQEFLDHRQEMEDPKTEVAGIKTALGLV
jgi:hypothetical protein